MFTKMRKALVGVLAITLLTGCGVKLDPVKKEAGDKKGVYYEIFMYSFYDSDGDGVGDFKGLTQKLDYLNDGDPKTKTDLGVDGVWLMPIMKSPSYHKYDVADYYDVDPQYGTMADFENFVKEAHKRGIKVMLDMVINHTSSQNPWFIDAKNNPKSPYREFYNFTNNKEVYSQSGLFGQTQQYYPADGDNYYQAVFWDQMPDLNYDSPKVRAEMKKVGKYWLDKGVDGFRLDAAMHIYDDQDAEKKNLAWWKEYKTYLETVKKDVYLVGEVWDMVETIAPYYEKGGLDSSFDFPLAGTQGQVAGALTYGNGKLFAKKLEENYTLFKSVNPDFIDAPFISNHDMDRIYTVLGDNVAKSKVAASMYLTLPGSPFIYYGEEIGMGGSKPDENLREYFKWFKEPKEGETKGPSAAMYSPKAVSYEEQLKDEKSLWNHYRNLIDIRNHSEALYRGDFKALEMPVKEISGYTRTADTTTAVILHNVSKNEVTFKIDAALVKDKETIFEAVAGEGKIKVKSDGTITMPAYSTVILQNVK